MTRGSTIFLRVVVDMLGLLVLGLCVLALPAGIMSDNTGMYKPILWGLYVPAIPFFGALYNALLLLGDIDHDKVFTQSAVDKLSNIKLCGAIISVLFALGIPYIYYVGERDDAPGVILMGLIIIGASAVIATAAGVFQSLLQNAVDIKSENDLTV